MHKHISLFLDTLKSTELQVLFFLNYTDMGLRNKFNEVLGIPLP